MGVLFHIRVHEIADFSKAVYAVLEFRYAEGKVVRHGRIDRESEQRCLGLIQFKERYA